MNKNVDGNEDGDGNRNVLAEDTEDATLMIISGLSDRATTLLSELETFRQHLKRIRLEGDVELVR